MTCAKNHHFSPSATAWICRLLLFIAACLLPGASHARADTAASKEYQVKAAFLLNFAQFIQWPESAFATPDAPLVVGVLGDDPFGAVLEQTFQDESIDGRKLVIKRSRRIEELKNCHMLFVGISEKDRMPDIMKTVYDASIVTVGEMDQFVQRGGIINFYVDNGKIRFEINAGLAQSKGFRINSQLLKRAKIIGLNSGKGKD